MDGSLIYAKTPKGVAEVGARGAQLSMVARRVLIMMDGKRTVDDLAVYVRAGEIGAIITQLESEGLAEKAGTAAATTVAPLAVTETAPAEAPAVAPPVPEERDLGPITLEEVKRRAVRELNDRLGPEADVIAMRIEACRNIDEFRERVRDAERYVAAALGAAAAQDYLRALRRGS
jgi:hypothetical protein